MLSAQEANRQYFREAYRTGEHGWPGDEPSPYAVDYLKRVKRAVPNGAVLDIGCGEGRHAFAAARLGFKVTAIDYEPLALQRARQFAKSEGLEGILFRKADVFSMPFPDSHFDIVLDWGCLHHQRKSDWLTYKKSILRVLKPEGYYALSVFSPKFYLFRGSRRRWHIAYGSYRRCFTPNEIVSLFGGEFEVIDMTEERGIGGGFWHVLMKRCAEPG
jgi:ubiquinone/menaquinone biosynthesis C-methylase UbiE